MQTDSERRKASSERRKARTRCKRKHPVGIRRWRMMCRPTQRGGKQEQDATQSKQTPTIRESRSERANADSCLENLEMCSSVLRTHEFRRPSMPCRISFMSSRALGTPARSDTSAHKQTSNKKQCEPLQPAGVLGTVLLLSGDLQQRGDADRSRSEASKKREEIPRQRPLPAGWPPCRRGGEPVLPRLSPQRGPLLAFPSL